MEGMWQRVMDRFHQSTSNDGNYNYENIQDVSSNNQQKESLTELQELILDREREQWYDIYKTLIDTHWSLAPKVNKFVMEHIDNELAARDPESYALKKRAMEQELYDNVLEERERMDKVARLKEMAQEIVDINELIATREREGITEETQRAVAQKMYEEKKAKEKKEEKPKVPEVKEAKPEPEVQEEEPEEEANEESNETEEQVEV